MTGRYNTDNTRETQSLFLAARRENRSLNTSNLREEINYIERISLNGPCPNTNLLPFYREQGY